jgi:hypothetical protein
MLQRELGAPVKLKQPRRLFGPAPLGRRLKRQPPSRPRPQGLTTFDS